MKINDSRYAEYKELTLLLTEKSVNNSSRRSSSKGNGKVYFYCFFFFNFSLLLSEGSILNNSLSGLMQQQKGAPWRDYDSGGPSPESFTERHAEAQLAFLMEDDCVS